jgi:hypothetical protein
MVKQSPNTTEKPPWGVENHRTPESYMNYTFIYSGLRIFFQEISTGIYSIDQLQQTTAT